MKKCTIILACVLLSCSIVWAEDAKYENVKGSSVIVEAWLVQVETDALYESGVEPIPQGDEQNVKITNLLWCLKDPNKATVIASAKTISGVNEANQFRLDKTEYVANKSGGLVQYRTDTNFETHSYFYIESKKIRIEYMLTIANFASDTRSAPLETINAYFKNVTTIMSGIPTIVAQNQLEDTSLFLILRAKVEQ